MSIKRDTLYNLGGSIAPMLVSLLTVPEYLHLIGNARYGVLAIVWLFVGYFGVFDPGITRAAAYHIARLHTSSQEKERESVFWTALAINLVFGLIGGIVLYCIARPIFMFFFKMPPSMKGEVLSSLPWLAASIPLSVTGGVLGGALQARDWFGFSNTVGTGTVLATQLAPLAVAYWHGPELTWLIPTVIVARLTGILPSMIALKWALPLGVGGRVHRTLLKPLFAYGGWIVITNLLTPVLTSLDRMVIGSVVSAEAVAFYTVPFNLTSRALIIPGALTTSLFPKLSRGSENDSSKLASDSLAALVAVMTPLMVLGIAALPIFLRIWVGRSFAAQAAPVGLILLLGIWINGLAYVPFSHLQASGRPDIVAKFHAIELLPFIGILWLGLHYFGLVGAAWAWTLRATFDAALLFIASGTVTRWRRLAPGCIFIILAAFCSPTIVLSARTLLELVLLAITTLWAWNLSPAIRVIVHRFIGGARLRSVA